MARQEAEWVSHTRTSVTGTHVQSTPSKPYQAPVCYTGKDEAGCDNSMKAEGEICQIRNDPRCALKGRHTRTRGGHLLWPVTDGLKRSEIRLIRTQAHASCDLALSK